MSTIDLQTLQKRLIELQRINERFAIPNCLEFLAGRSGIPVVEIKNELAEATISLEGGQVMTFRPHDQEHVLWLSSFAPLKKEKSIRGGIPVCWPWFGAHAFDKQKPAHGFARNMLWTVKETKIRDDGATKITLELSDNEDTWSLWPHTFQLQLQIIIGSQLQLELSTYNIEDKNFIVSEALHSYFRISDVNQVKIHGLEYCTYLDKVDNFTNKIQKGTLTINDEVDRIYLGTTADCVIEDYGLKRNIRIAKQKSQSTVVWNPGMEKASELGDLGHRGFRKMVCVETANVAENAITVEPSDRHSLKVVISVEPLSWV
jgi:D-hexose-6-phosphate mutarotase